MNPVTISFLGYPKVIPYTQVFFSYAADKQTDGLKILPMPIDRVGVGN